MAKTKHGLPETKGNYQVRGIVTGMNREDSFKSQTFDSGSTRNTLKFGVKTDSISSVYPMVEGYKSEKAYLFKQSEVKGQKPTQKIVPWDERYDYEEEGFFVIGTRIGLEKDENGKNVISTLTAFDAAHDLSKDLKDNTSVFIKGKLDYSSFKNREGDKIKSRKMLADAIYLNSKEIDFEEEDFTPLNDFQQRLVFMEIEKDTSSKEPKFLLQAKVVTRQSIEDVEFVIYDKSLANTFKQNLKPYTAITVSGAVKCSLDVEEVKEEKVTWGKENSFTKVNNSIIREFVVEGADPESIDDETYTAEALEEAIAKLNEEGQQKAKTNNETSGDWGKGKKVDIQEDELPW